MRRWKTCLQHLEEVRARLDKESEAATLRIDSLAHPDLVVNPRHNPIISCKDVAFSRCESYRLLIFFQSITVNFTPNYEIKLALCDF